MLEALDWKFLPFPGGLLDQPDWLISDLMIIAWYKGWMEERLTVSLPGRADVRDYRQ